MFSAAAFARKGLSSPPKEGLIPAISLGHFFLSLFKNSLQQRQSPCKAPTRKVKPPEEGDALFIAEFSAIALTKGQSLSHADPSQPSQAERTPWVSAARCHSKTNMKGNVSLGLVTPVLQSLPGGLSCHQLSALPSAFGDSLPSL